MVEAIERTGFELLGERFSGGTEGPMAQYGVLVAALLPKANVLIDRITTGIPGPFFPPGTLARRVTMIEANLEHT